MYLRDLFGEHPNSSEGVSQAPNPHRIGTSRLGPVDFRRSLFECVMPAINRTGNMTITRTGD
jgi:hypothetical protein